MAIKCFSNRTVTKIQDALDAGFTIKEIRKDLSKKLSDDEIDTYMAHAQAKVLSNHWGKESSLLVTEGLDHKRWKAHKGFKLSIAAIGAYLQNLFSKKVRA